MTFGNIVDAELNKRFREFYAEVDASNSTLSTLVCFNMAYAANRKKSGPINHFKSAELKQSCNFWVEMELESGGMAGPGSTDKQRSMSSSTRLVLRPVVYWLNRLKR